MIGSTELWILLILAVLLFGGTQIPKLARAMGRAKQDFKEGMKEGEQEAGKERDQKAAEAARKQDPGAKA